MDKLELVDLVKQTEGISYKISNILRDSLLWKKDLNKEELLHLIIENQTVYQTLIRELKLCWD